MWIYEKKLEFPINIRKPDARLAKIMIEQYGGAYSNRVLLFPKISLSRHSLVKLIEPHQNLYQNSFSPFLLKIHLDH
jgi:spore coat protein JC